MLLTGCEDTTDQGQDRHLINSELINSYSDIAVQNAIISQHTLYPYHFVNNSAELNELGLRDLGILAAHFEKNPGKLNIRRNGTSADVYKGRIDLVVAKLEGSGIDTKQMSIADGMPGGSGITSEKIILIMEDEYQNSSKGN
jgi:hypothetical protein